MSRTAALALCLISSAASAAEDAFRFQSLDALRAEAVEGSTVEPSHEDAYRLVMKNLAGAQVPAEFVRAAFDDPATRIVPEIPERFKKPAEALPYEKYRQYFVSEAKIARGAEFYAEHQELLSAVSRRFAVEPFVLVSLLGVETHYGAGSGRIPVFNALYTIVRALPGRSAWAARELSEFLKLCRREGFSPHGVLGSYAGAFGYYQFMPSSYNAYAVDFDGDGRSDFDRWPDVLASMAHFLKGHGAGPSEDYAEGSKNRRAIHGYNPSDNYVRAVVELREAVKARARAAAFLAPDPAGRAATAARTARMAQSRGVRWSD